MLLQLQKHGITHPSDITYQLLGFIHFFWKVKPIDPDKYCPAVRNAAVCSKGRLIIIILEYIKLCGNGCNQFTAPGWRNIDRLGHR